MSKQTLLDVEIIFRTCFNTKYCKILLLRSMMVYPLRMIFVEDGG